jgi:hypothetical protein
MAQHRGQRSELGRQRRYAKHVIAETSRLDRRKGEQICMLTGPQILDRVEQEFGDVIVHVTNFEKGEVIIDSRGTGSFQRLPRNLLDWSLAIGL